MTPPRDGVLVIEASSARGSVAWLRDGRAVDSRVVLMGAGRDDALFPALLDLLGASTATPRLPATIVCGSGPGSFTSLRIAASLAKGLAHGAGLPLCAVSSLLLAAAGAPLTGPETFVVHADALRSERYMLEVGRDTDGRIHARGPVRRVTPAWLVEHVPPEARVSVGAEPPGVAGWCCVHPEASELARVAPVAYQTPVALAVWEPDYGRLAEAQVQWEVTHGVPLPVAGLTPA
jgi:tRNA threonylcarbamoyladenosine biosynthesis protein TsaB